MHSSSKEKMHGSPGMWCIQALREDALITWDVMHSSSTEKMHCLPGMWCIQSLHGWPTACPGGKVLKSKHNFFSWNGVPGLLFIALASVLQAPKLMMTLNRSSAASCKIYLKSNVSVMLNNISLFYQNILGFPFLLLSCLICKTQLLWCYPGQVFED